MVASWESNAERGVKKKTFNNCPVFRLPVVTSLLGGNTNHLNFHKISRFSKSGLKIRNLTNFIMLFLFLATIFYFHLFLWLRWSRDPILQWAYYIITVLSFRGNAMEWKQPYLLPWIRANWSREQSVSSEMFLLLLPRLQQRVPLVCAYSFQGLLQEESIWLQPDVCQGQLVKHNSSRTLRP